MQPPNPRERIAVIRALLAAVDAELDQIPVVQTAASGMSAGMIQHLVEQNVCPECGINWREPSPMCPKILYNRHRLA